MVLVAMGMTLAVAAPAEVRDHLGSPTIFIGGEPRTPLVFFGIPQRHPIAAVSLSEEWQEFHMTFVAPEDNDGMGGVQIRLGGGPPGTVWVDDLRVYPGVYRPDAPNTMLQEAGFEGAADSVGAAWTMWLSPESGADVSWSLDATQPAEGRQCLRVTIRDGGSNPMHVHFFQSGMSYRKGQTYTYSLKMRSTETRKAEFFALRQGPPFRIYGDDRSPVYGRQVAMAAEAGVHIHSFTVPMPWPREGEEPDFSGVDAAIDWTLENDPDALLVPRFWLGPPEWWYEEHPEARQLFSDGQTDGWSVSSPEWLADALTHLRSLVRHCELTYGDHMLGYHPTGQNTGEWFTLRSWERVLGDFSPAAEQGFRRWLSKRYGSDEALREAWGVADASLETTTVPSAEERLSSQAGLFRDPAAEARVIDYLRFEQDAVVDCLEQIARAIKEETRGERLVVLFYGYTFELAGLPYGPAKSGHYALARLLECPDVDILCSPISYQDRELGGSGDTMTAIDSVRRAGKLWLVEDDSRTHVTPPEEQFPGGDPLASLEETRWIHTRQLGHLLPRRTATWYMDLGGTGWLDDPGIWQHIAQLRRVYDEAMEEPATWSPEVAVIVDEGAGFYTASDWLLHRSLVYEMRIHLARLGAPQGWYLLDDLVAGKVPPAKAYIFLNCFHLGSEQRRAVRTETRSRAAVWLYGGGYLDDGPAPKTAPGALEPSMAEVIGLPILRAAPFVAPDPLAGPDWFPGTALLDPFWVVSEGPGLEVLSRFEDGRPAAVLGETAEGLRAYFPGVGFDIGTMRTILRRAGVHIYCESDDVILTDDRFLCISATSDGPKGIRLGRPALVEDALTGVSLSEGGPEIRLEMRRGEAKLLRLGG